MKVPTTAVVPLMQLGFMLVGACLLLAFSLPGEPALAAFDSVGAGLIASVALSLFGRNVL